MMLALRVVNFRSIGKDVVLSMEATSKKDLKHVVRQPQGRMPKTFGGVLPLAILYGANGSGKSNICRAAETLRAMVLSSGADATEGEGPIEGLIPFMLSSAYEKEPTLMEISFLLKGVHYLYGFESTPTAVVSEWLLAWPKGVEQKWFLRGDAARAEGGKDWYFGPGWEGGEERGRLLAEQTRKDALYVTVASRFNHSQAHEIVNWFKSNFRFIDHTKMMSELYTQRQSVERPEFAEWASKVMHAADVGIVKVETREQKAPGSDERIQGILGMFMEKERKRIEKTMSDRFKYHTKTLHQHEDGQLVEFDLADQESHGTKRLFSLIGPLRNVLEEGLIVWIDELNTGLHHWLVRCLVQLFQDPKLNPRGAQLVITSHDPLLLDNHLMRRDQIFLTEKNNTGMTELYSLAEFKEDRKAPRIGAALTKQYLAGRFGGVPRVKADDFLDWLPQKNVVDKQTDQSSSTEEN